MTNRKTEAPRAAKAAEPAPYVLSSEMQAAIQAVHDALGRRKTLDEATNAAPAQIAELEQEANRLRGEIASREADIIWCADTEVPAAEGAIAKLSDELITRETELRRAKSRLDALEARAPELDAAVDQAGYMLNLEVGMQGEIFRARISEELREAVKPLLPILEKARAMGPLFNDYLQAAYLPDPEGFILGLRSNGAISSNVGVNLLNGVSNVPNPITEVMAPVNAALNALRSHRAYVPLAKRPKPYVMKGAWDGPGGRTGPRPPEVEKPSAPRKTMEEALKEPYTIKGDSSGIRTWKEAQRQAAEMDIGRTMMAAADSADY